MDQSPTFARQFARLLWLLMHDAANVDEQKMSLRALTTVCKLGAVALRTREGRIVANRHLVPVAMSGVAELLQQLRAHGVEKVKFDKGTPARELLAFLKILAAPAGAAGFRKSFDEIDAKHIDAIIAAPAVSQEAPTVITPADRPAQPAPAPAVPTPEATKAAESAAALMAELGSRDVSKMTPEELFRALDRAGDADAVARALEDVVALAEHSVRAAKGPVAATLLHELVVREQKERDPDARKSYAAAFRKLTKPAVLRAVASLVPKRPEKKQHYYEILERAEEAGADAVIEQINQAPTSADRKQLLDIFRELKHGTESLVRMLGDSRWFVVRNAADLLGELVVVQAQEPLIDLLGHADDRVRRSATNALLKLGTPDATRKVYEAMGDASPEVRMQVAAAIASKKDHRTSSTLIRAIEEEDDSDVQLAMIAALGRVATAEAVQKLVKMAEPEGRLFKKKDAALRVAAVQALGDARTPAAITALKTLLDDKEREVRETASRALAQSPR
ncbi:MAG TPA: HEAT repeat domain-containing protein [Gemmatimonadaceae bacterium]|nr:HEAT repeat domain-containing protein [Gemmatimonadaceae bacterium]